MKLVFKVFLKITFKNLTRKRKMFLNYIIFFKKNKEKLFKTDC